MHVQWLVPILFLLLFAQPTSDSFTDARDGQVYEIVTIGQQTWMAENLNFLTSESSCYDNHPFNCRRYGRLYNWWEATTICPEGWHLPSDRDWNRLYQYYGNTIDAYKEMVDGVFNAELAGWYSDGGYHHIGKRAYFWSSTDDDEHSARYYRLDASLLTSSSTKKSIGFYCRCIQD